MNSPQIIFDNPTCIYSPGSQICGYVQFNTSKRQQFDAVIIEFYGEAKTNFTTTEQRTFINSGTYQTKLHSVEVEIPCEGRIVYWNKSLVLWSSAECLSFFTDGLHQLPFAIQIPNECAPSFEGVYGSIRYHCKVKFDVASWFDKGTEAQITVVRPVNLSVIPLINLPVQSEISHEVSQSCHCCSNEINSIRLKTFLHKRGYNPGELIEVTVEVMNSTNKVLKKLLLKIVQITMYIGYSGNSDNEQCTVDEHTVTSAENVVHIGAKSLSVIRQRITVPKVPGSFSECRLIQLKYALRVKITARKSERYSVGTNIPITIGTIPAIPTTG
uniref:Arrestin_C domain-containing protein n=1 Tax=Syphacia muris TaxID=451379 RepID=A0A0N5ARD9_9BILA